MRRIFDITIDYLILINGDLYITLHCVYIIPVADYSNECLETLQKKRCISTAVDMPDRQSISRAINLHIYLGRFMTTFVYLVHKHARIKPLKRIRSILFDLSSNYSEHEANRVRFA